jgi:DNA polymerase III alpha subunit
LKLLARAGAFESLFSGRREALWATLLRLQRKHETPLLDLIESDEARLMPRMSELEQINADYKTLGLSTGKHPMSFYRNWAQKQGIKSCAQLKAEEHGQKFTVAGGVICRQRPETAKGFVFLTVEDETGMANVIVKPKLFDKYRKVFMSPYLAITGILQSEQGVINLLAEHVETLPPLEHETDLPTRNFH